MKEQNNNHIGLAKINAFQVIIVTFITAFASVGTTLATTGYFKKSSESDTLIIGPAPDAIKLEAEIKNLKISNGFLRAKVNKNKTHSSFQRAKFASTFIPFDNNKTACKAEGEAALLAAGLKNIKKLSGTVFGTLGTYTAIIGCDTDSGNAFIMVYSPDSGSAELRNDIKLKFDI